MDSYTSHFPDNYPKQHINKTHITLELSADTEPAVCLSKTKTENSKLKHFNFLC